MAPEDDRPAVAILLRKNVVQHHGETVEVTNVKRAEVGMEGIVQQAVVDAEVYGRRPLLRRRMLRPGRPLAGRSRLLRGRVWERCVLIGLVGVGSEVQAVFNMKNSYVRNGLSRDVKRRTLQRGIAWESRS